MKNNDLVVGLDIGTTKICCIVGRPGERGGMEIVGFGHKPSFGMRRGVVVNIDSLAETAKTVLAEAEMMAGVEIDRVFVGLSGAHIKSFNSRGVVAIKGGEVTAEDVERVIEAARAVSVPQDREMLHCIAQQYIVDDQDGFKDPHGISGVRLEADVHIVTGAVAQAQNIIKCCNSADVDVADIVLEQIASAEAVLTPDEREIGVVVIDIGGGTTDIAVFHDGVIKFSAVVGLGGDHLTGDIVQAFSTPRETAEMLKRTFGHCVNDEGDHQVTFDVPGVGGRPAKTVAKNVLTDILAARVDEILSLARGELLNSGMYDSLPAGIVLTGGTSILPGMVEQAERVFKLPVRRGSPRNISGVVDEMSSPVYATAVGLVKFGIQNMEANHFRRGQKTVFERIFERMKEMFRNVSESL